jgi:hypothetical protein
MIDKSLMLCARDIEQMYFSGIPLHKAIRHMQYLLAPYEVRAAQRELKRKEVEPYKLYKSYKGAKR